ncbi:MAG: DMT family transporter, partial [Erysipelotrichaceae bacterium]|nr:DMT family transporter [Erysipelotrichaceae bacterium]
MIGNILLVLTALIWGTAFVFQRMGVQNVEPMTFNSSRMLLAAVAVGIVAFILGRKDKEKLLSKSLEEQRAYRKNTIIGGIFCGLFLAGGSAFQQMGLVYTTAGKAGFITALYILIVPIVSFIFFRKKINWIVWLAVIIGVFGMYLLCVNEGFSLTKGDLLVTVCAFIFSGHILCIDHFVKLGDTIRISAIQFVTATVLLGILAFIFEEPSWEDISKAVIPILYCGIISGGVGYTLQMVGQKFTSPTVASLLMSLESVFAALAGALILHESMSLK